MRNNKELNCLLKMISIVCAALLLLSVMCFTSCSIYRYNKDWIIGKTSAEIEKRYGNFTIYSAEPDTETGLFYSCMCGYQTQRRRVGYLGTIPDKFYVIYFGNDGRAFDVDEEWYVPGG
jgi:hypothetical protein